MTKTDERGQPSPRPKRTTIYRLAPTAARAVVLSCFREGEGDALRARRADFVGVPTLPLAASDEDKPSGFVSLFSVCAFNTIR